MGSKFYSFPPPMPAVAVHISETVLRNSLVTSVRNNAQRGRLVGLAGRRRDGWPLCPMCGEDEAYSTLMLGWDGNTPRPTLEDCLGAPFRCYCHPGIEFTIRRVP